MAQALSIDILFDAAIRIQVLHDRNISDLVLGTANPGEISDNEETGRVP